MKKVGVILLGIGFGILCYVIFVVFFQQSPILSPIEQAEMNKVIKQNTK